MDIQAATLTGSSIDQEAPAGNCRGFLVIAASEPGLASGMVNTSFMMGGALGLAVLAILAAVIGAAALSKRGVMAAAQGEVGGHGL